MLGYNTSRRAENETKTAHITKTIFALVKQVFALIGKPLFLLIILFTIIGFFAVNILKKPIYAGFYFKKNIKLPAIKLPKIIKFTPSKTWRARKRKKIEKKLIRPKISLPIKINKRLVALVIFFAFVFWTIHQIRDFIDIPNVQTLSTRQQEMSTKIYDRNGKLLFKIYKNKNRTIVPLNQIPLAVRQATVAIEDAEFYQHHGVSVKGIVRSAWRNIVHGELTGGSTITQQLVKNALLTPQKTITRKIKEVILAIRVESTFSKDQILEMYLNEVAYGGSAYGIEEASHLYFGKGAKDLDLAQSALLAGLPKAPTTYSPFGANPQLARARQTEVLSRMVEEGYITAQEADIAAREKLTFAPQRTDIKAPHFVMYIKQLLAEKYGELSVEEGGLSVYTTLDLDIQEQAEKIVAEEIKKVQPLHITNGSVLITDPKTGDILAMVGSKNYFDQSIDGNFNVTTAARQPGSSIKPVNYSYALESKKYTAASLIDDSPITFQSPGAPAYSPKNYDNTFRGLVTLRTALGSSLNVPAVKVLASYGVGNMISQGQKLGITTWTDPSRYGLSLTLGSGDVKMTDMAVVYGTLANYGSKVTLNPILKVVDSKDTVLEQKNCQPPLGFFDKIIKKAFAAEATPMESCSQNVLDPKVAFILTNILSDNNARIPAFGPNSLLVIPNHPEVAVKTGTTQNLRDNWTIGYTKDFVVVTWVGNNDNSPMSYVASGITGASPIWHRIMESLLKDKPSFTWSMPSGVKKVNICSVTGTLPCEGCPAREEYFIQGTEPTQSCNLNQFYQEQQKKEEQKILPAETTSQ